nr:Chain R, Dynein light chain 4A [Tetrahymena thermophila]
MASEVMNLSEEDIQFCQKAFSDYDEDGLGAIKVSDLKLALENIGCSLSENDLFKMISEVDEKNTGLIKFSDFLNIYYKQKYANLGDDDQDLVDAFVAMGGNADTTGSVDANRLIQIVKEEFEMTIDIVGLIREIDKDGSGEIEYEEFKLL